MTKKQTKAQSTKKQVDPVQDAVVKNAVVLGDTVRTAVNAVLETIDVGSIIAEFDPGWSEDQVDDICNGASTYLIDQLLGGMCYQALDVNKFGEQMLQSAFDQLASAQETAERYPGPSSDAQVDAKMRWVTQQLVQKSYRGNLIHMVMGAYSHTLEKPYQIRKPAVKSEQARTATHEGAKKLLKMRAAAK